MTSSFFYIQAEKNEQNQHFLDQLENYADTHKVQVYVINRPLGNPKYSYEYDGSFVILIPKHKIIFVDYLGDSEQFNEYQEDFIEDIGSLSDKFRYREIIGRPRAWKEDLISSINRQDIENVNLEQLLSDNYLSSSEDKKKCELLISLLIGSINDINRVKKDIPDNLLDRVKQKILLFDGDQTRFIYQKSEEKVTQIQGLSGTGKTELLLHKLKELYTENKNSKIMFTCHNRILADSLKKRIPEFFNFMKVEEQIEWNTRLLCDRAWGSRMDQYSGAYRYICYYYQIPFMTWTDMPDFDKACQLALSQLPDIISDYAFDFMLIDESQDFPESFFKLCQKTTKNTLYIAGDIFQSIFDTNIIGQVNPDFLLSKCYRTDPRTLMFAHALGMGLFESPKLRWMTKDEWEACGYIVEENSEQNTYTLSREPLRRFEDIDDANYSSFQLSLEETNIHLANKIVEILKELKQENPTLTENDVAIIFVEDQNYKFTYYHADILEKFIQKELEWKVNKGYQSKEKIQDRILITNTNHVKGLEFPFVIAVTPNIVRNKRYRNALYMTLTRSFLKTFLLVCNDEQKNFCHSLNGELKKIESHRKMTVTIPSQDELERINKTIEVPDKKIPLYEYVSELFDEFNIPQDRRTLLRDTVNTFAEGKTEIDDDLFQQIRGIVEGVSKSINTSNKNS